MRSQLIFGAALTVFTACADVSSPRDAAAGVTIEIRNDALVVRNHLTAPVCYFPFEQEYTVRAQPVFGGSECRDPISAGNSLSIPLAGIPGWNAEASNVILYWWVYGSGSHPGPFANRIHTLVAGR